MMLSFVHAGYIYSMVAELPAPGELPFRMMNLEHTTVIHELVTPVSYIRVAADADVMDTYGISFTG